MATENNVLKTRIQLKSDSETNWNSTNNFVPLAGELIIYTADNNHSFRLKCGDGSTNVKTLPFIDSDIIISVANYNELPNPGMINKIYIDTSTNQIYQYIPSRGYVQLAVPSSKAKITCITSWQAGSSTTFTISNNTLRLTTGYAPILGTEDINV